MSSSEGPVPDAWLISGSDTVRAWPCMLAAPGRAVVDAPTDFLLAPPEDLEIVVLQLDGNVVRLPVTQIGLVHTLDTDAQRTIAVLGFPPSPDIRAGLILEKALVDVLGGQPAPEGQADAGASPAPTPPEEITDLTPPADRGEPIPVTDFRPPGVATFHHDFGICSLVWWLCR